MTSENTCRGDCDKGVVSAVVVLLLMMLAATAALLERVASMAVNGDGDGSGSDEMWAQRGQRRWQP